MVSTVLTRPGFEPLSGAVAETVERLRPSVVSVRGVGRHPGIGAGVIWRADGLVVT